MVKCGSLMKSTLVAAVLLAVIQFGSADKLAECCTTVSKTPIKERITGYMIQKPHPPCVPAVIIQTATGVYCVQVNAYWVKARITAFEKSKREATTQSVVPSSTVSLLSVMTSTTSPASTAASIPTATSSPPTTQTPADESFAENKYIQPPANQ